MEEGGGCVCVSNSVEMRCAFTMRAQGLPPAAAALPGSQQRPGVNYSRLQSRGRKRRPGWMLSTSVISSKFNLLLFLLLFLLPKRANGGGFLNGKLAFRWERCAALRGVTEDDAAVTCCGGVLPLDGLGARHLSVRPSVCLQSPCRFNADLTIELRCRRTFLDLYSFIIFVLFFFWILAQ